jgi:predicted methyltransferase
MRLSYPSFALFGLGLSFFSSACASAPATRATTPPPDYTAVVAAPDRAEDDRKLDAGRKPAAMLELLDVRPGMRVADLATGLGYTAELMARVVGPTGKVYAQNNKLVLGFVGAGWDARLQTPAMKIVVRVDREMDAPLPPEATGLDLVVMNAFYHDLVWQKTDRAAFNKAVLAALRPGGTFVIIDSSAVAGHGVDDAQTLHRIDEAVVRKEVEAAGFRLAGSSEFLRNPADARDWNASPRAAGERRGTSDRFALKFVKP